MGGEEGEEGGEEGREGSGVAIMIGLNQVLHWVVWQARLS